MDAPQLYLIAPTLIPASEMAARLAAVLDTHPVACLRLPGAGDEGELARLADLARDIAHARDVAVVIENHIPLARAHGLDGVHLTDGARSVRYARKELGADAIVGAFCGTSRHEGMSAGEAGADYVAFGPCGSTALGRGTPVDLDLFQWWSDVVEVPVVAEGALDAALIRSLWTIADFIAVGPEIWSAADPAAALSGLWPA
ncbi:thiamine phosphate synthase [Paracoccus endophyticus]|uniref:thiamine phosphate synthase n=1 Tax=Paracoccus endophyticus TaxID=2233774 RepID=UPI000DDB929A|nr:thiamine phosphate synthase [Paracoccus endophyticus]